MKSLLGSYIIYSMPHEQTKRYYSNSAHKSTSLSVQDELLQCNSALSACNAVLATCNVNLARHDADCNNTIFNLTIALTNRSANASTGIIPATPAMVIGSCNLSHSNDVIREELITHSLYKTYCCLVRTNNTLKCSGPPSCYSVSDCDKMCDKEGSYLNKLMGSNTKWTKHYENCDDS